MRDIEMQEMLMCIMAFVCASENHRQHGKHRC